MPHRNSNLVSFTTAPVDYDYGWQIILIDNYALIDGKVIRKCINEDEWHLERQKQRYGSGMYPSWTVAQMEQLISEGRAIQTPDVMVFHYRGEVSISRDVQDYQPFIDLIDHYEKMNGVEFKSLNGGLTQQIHVLNDLDLFENIVRRLTGAAQAGTPA